MEETKNLCVQLPISLHAKVRAEQEKSGKVLTAYFTELLTEYYEKKEKKMENTRTLAFQVPEEMFQRIKEYLTAESERVGRKISQREFILGLTENALEQREETTEQVNGNQSEYN
jgi:hypothetical protein